jgi:hypothetical protein
MHEKAMSFGQYNLWYVQVTTHHTSVMEIKEKFWLYGQVYDEFVTC